MELSQFEFTKVDTIATASGVFEVKYGGKVLAVGDVSHNYPEVAEGCRAHCPRYGTRYSCPPFAPGFDVVSCGFDYLAVYYLQMYVEQLSQKTLYQKIQTASAMLGARMNRALRKLEAVTPDSLMMACSRCRLCRKCTAVSGESCAKPERLRYSLQSTGVSVSSIADEKLGVPINWTWNGEYKYSMVVGGLLLKERKLPVLEIERELK